MVRQYSAWTLLIFSLFFFLGQFFVVNFKFIWDLGVHCVRNFCEIWLFKIFYINIKYGVDCKLNYNNYWEMLALDH